MWNKDEEERSMDRMLKVKLLNDKELILDDITSVDSESPHDQLKVYRDEDLIATLDKGKVKSWYIRSGYGQRSK
jgi:hypothetical protein